MLCAPNRPGADAAIRPDFARCGRLLGVTEFHPGGQTDSQNNQTNPEGKATGTFLAFWGQ